LEYFPAVEDVKTWQLLREKFFAVISIHWGFLQVHPGVGALGEGLGRGEGIGTLFAANRFAFRSA
jgi:hypothetical protein